MKITLNNAGTVVELEGDNALELTKVIKGLINNFDGSSKEVIPTIRNKKQINTSQHNEYKGWTDNDIKLLFKSIVDEAKTTVDSRKSHKRIKNIMQLHGEVKDRSNLSMNTYLCTIKSWLFDRNDTATKRITTRMYTIAEELGYYKGMLAKSHKSTESVWEQYDPNKIVQEA